MIYWFHHNHDGVGDDYAGDENDDPVLPYSKDFAVSPVYRH